MESLGLRYRLLLVVAMTLATLVIGKALVKYIGLDDNLALRSVQVLATLAAMLILTRPYRP